MLRDYDISLILCSVVPQLIIVISSYIILFKNVKKSITMYSVWLLVNIIVNTSMSWPLSVCRYFTCALPLFIYIADYLKNHRKLFIVYIIISSVLLGIYFVAYLMGLSVL